MGVTGVTNVTLHAPRPEALSETWTVPAYCCTVRSYTIQMAIGDDPVVIRSRLAKTLNIEEDDSVEFRFEETGETFPLKVKIRDDIWSDVIIHDFMALGIAENISVDMHGEIVTFKSGQKLLMPEQNMFSGVKIENKQGSACLFFSGASKHTPKGPSGFGFHIVEGSDGKGYHLVEGHGYSRRDRSSNEMEYAGLIEGLIWATRLDLESLTICTDSELIINQVNGKYEIKNRRLKNWYDLALPLIENNKDLKIEFKKIYPDKNGIADNLAHRAIVTKRTAMSVNWPNVNKLMTQGAM